MHKESVFFRREALGTIKLNLPGKTYNALKHVLTHEELPRVFIPVKSLSSIAVISADEVLFVDQYMRKMVEYSWTSFKPQNRTEIHSPVDYIFTWHNERSFELMDQAPAEISKSITRHLKLSKKHLLRPGKLIYLGNKN